MNDLRIIERSLDDLPQEAVSLDRPASDLVTEQLRDMLLRKAKVLAITGLSRATLYREIGAGRFPQPVPHHAERRGVEVHRHRKVDAGAESY